MPEQLTEKLEPLHEAATWEDILESHLYNMERTGICYARYETLVDAIRAREKAITKSGQP